MRVPSPSDRVFAVHPLLKPDAVEDRDYQRALSEAALRAPHLLVLPTGLGKTVVALRALADVLAEGPDRRVLFLAPTKPLAEQQAAFLRETLLDVGVACFTGETAPQDRDREWAGHRVIVATPQVVQNDVVRGAQTLSDVSFLVFDEAHRAVGNYPYTFLARAYRQAGGRRALGLTASPGNAQSQVHRVLSNLGLERIEVRTEADVDVAPYVHQVETQWVRVRPTATLLRVVKLLERCYGRCALSLRRLGFFQLLRGLPSRRDLLDLGQRLRSQAAAPHRARGVYEAVSLQARALKIQHALELAETQGSPLVFRYLQRIQQEAAQSGGSKAARDFVREPEFLEALALARDDASTPPKIARILEQTQAEIARGARRVLAFANYRETAEALVERLAQLPGVRVDRFVGHATAQGERGMTKKEQQAVVDRFRSGDLNVLVATAVGEEGLDLPETDAVMLHEPVASAIRMIQRRGRTGRRGDGTVYVFLTEGTRDEAYYWSAVRRERRMRAELHALRRTTLPLTGAPAADPPRPIPARPPPGPSGAGLEVAMDPRESRSPVARLLLERGIRIKTVPMTTGDYRVSQRIVVERKSATDFAASLRDGRLFEQLGRLAQHETGVVLVEGDPFSARTGLSPASLAGALAAALADHRVSIVSVPDAQASADLLTSLARRELRDGHAGPYRSERPAFHPEGQLLYLVQGLPGIGPVLARRLLEHFGSVAELAAASPEGLQEVDGVGPETAGAIHEIFRRPFVAARPAGLPGQAGRTVMAVEAGNGPAG